MRLQSEGGDAARLLILAATGAGESVAHFLPFCTRVNPYVIEARARSASMFESEQKDKKPGVGDLRVGATGVEEAARRARRRPRCPTREF